MRRSVQRALVVLVALGAVSLASAGAASAQELGGGNTFNVGGLDEFIRSGRNRDLNPTGFGKPGEFWSMPTGSRIARGPKPKPEGQALAKAAKAPAEAKPATPETPPPQVR